MVSNKIGKFTLGLFLFLIASGSIVSAESYLNEGFSKIANITKDAATLLENPILALVIAMGLIMIVIAVVLLVVNFTTLVTKMPLDMFKKK